MTYNNQFEEVLNEVYAEGKISRNEAEMLANNFNALGPAKKVPERAEFVLTGAVMLDELREADLLPRYIEEDVNMLKHSLEQYEFVDWEEQTVDNEYIENNFFDLAQSGIDPTPEGIRVLDDLDEDYDVFVGTWNQALDYMSSEYGRESESPANNAHTTDVDGTDQTAQVFEDTQNSGDGIELEDHEFGLMESIGIKTIKIGEMLNFGGDNQ